MSRGPDSASASEHLLVGVGAPHADAAGVHTDFRVQRFDEDQTRYAAARYAPGTLLTPRRFAAVGVTPTPGWGDTTDYDCNMIVQNGWIALLGGVAGTTMSPKFSATNGRIGVGTSTTAAAFSQTTLVGDTGAASTTSYFKLVSGAPTISTAATPPTLVFSSVFGTAVANFAWQEFGTDAGTADSVSNATTGGTFFNRGVSSQGTKASGQTWTATETISFGYPSGSGTVS